MSSAEVVKFWEDLFDEYKEVAEELFFDALLRDARAEYARRTRNGQQEEDEEDRRRAPVFEPWQPAMPDTAAPVPAPPTQPVVVPAVKRTVVLGLRAPPHLARKHERTTPSGSAAGRPPTGKKLRVV